MEHLWFRHITMILRKGKTFFYDNANSQVGELSNFFLKEYNAKRSLDPIFSHAIKGKLKRKLLLSKTDECFSEESILKSCKL